MKLLDYFPNNSYISHSLNIWFWKLVLLLFCFAFLGDFLHGFSVQRSQWKTWTLWYPSTVPLSFLWWTLFWWHPQAAHRVFIVKMIPVTAPGHMATAVNSLYYFVVQLFTSKPWCCSIQSALESIIFSLYTAQQPGGHCTITDNLNLAIVTAFRVRLEVNSPRNKYYLKLNTLQITVLALWFVFNFKVLHFVATHFDFQKTQNQTSKNSGIAFNLTL